MKKFELTHTDYRAGTTHVLRKIADYLSSDEAKGGGEKEKDFSSLKEFDLDEKVTAKELAEAYNDLVKMLKS